MNTYLTNFLAIGGGLLLLFVLLELVLLFYTSLRRAANVNIQRSMEIELFSKKIALASLQLKRQEQAGSWSGTRKFQIEKIVKECEDVASFYLAPHDKRPLPVFLPGQFLTFELDIPGQRSRVIRCYSLSDRPRPDYYRVTIKRINAIPDVPGSKPGLASTYFHTALKEGDILDVKAPGGGFFLNTSHLTPVVLLSGGVGITPMISMLHEIMELTPQREVWFFFCVKNGQEHIMKKVLENLDRENDRLHLHVCYSRPEKHEVKGGDFHHEGRLNVELLKQRLPSNNYDYFMCGPGAMMKDLNEGLLEWGVPEEKIHMEAFGPASVKKAATAAPDASAVKFKVSFSRSSKDVHWTGEVDSLLDLALAESVPMGYGCRAGNCGSCKTAIKSGKVKYQKKPGFEVEAGSCLTCIAVPEGDLHLDA